VVVAVVEPVVVDVLCGEVDVLVEADVAAASVGAELDAAAASSVLGFEAVVVEHAPSEQIATANDATRRDRTSVSVTASRP